LALISEKGEREARPKLRKIKHAQGEMCAGAIKMKNMRLS
jgi:hypothetical protein